MPTPNELDKWFCHLTVATKESALGLPYPTCTERWNSLTVTDKERIYNEAGGRDAHDHHKWKKGNTSLT